jgi:thiazole synthase
VPRSRFAEAGLSDGDRIEVVIAVGEADRGRQRQDAARRGCGKLVIAGKPYASRLLVGTGKYRDFDETRRAIEASGAEIVTVAIRRTNIGQNAGEPNLLEVLPPSKFTDPAEHRRVLQRAGCGAHACASRASCSTATRS